MTSLYIHIPFCKKKCNYCDFVSYAGKEELIEEYVKNIINEIHCLDLGFRISDLNTIYFGGGTPTLLEPSHFERILLSLSRSRGCLILGGEIEISIEANPGTATKEKLKALRDLGINRISIGAQSFNDKHLKTLGRIHDSKDIFRIYDDARSAGFDNINLDLIFALPNQTLDEWKTDLKTAVNLNPNHLSTYNLQIEEGTAFFKKITKSQAPNSKQITIPKLQLPSEEEELAMYEYTIETLVAAGYKHYEISNFAKPGFECKHNINYWKNGNYIGIGAGAHSHVNGKRWANPSSINEYLGTATFSRRFPDGLVTDRRETIFLGLRLLEGLSIDEFKGFEKEVKELMGDGLLEQKNGNYRLTRQGLYLGNLVFEKFV